MKTPDDIADWVRRETGSKKSIDDATSLQELGVYGDDWHELMDVYADRFGVDMSRYLWYFHTREEGQNFGGLLVPPPHRRAPQIPITLAMLRAFADSGKWTIDYPEHQIPEKRYDILINQVVVGVITVGLVAFLIWKYL